MVGPSCVSTSLRIELCGRRCRGLASAFTAAALVLLQIAPVVRAQASTTFGRASLVVYDLATLRSVGEDVDVIAHLRRLRQLGVPAAFVAADAAVSALAPDLPADLLGRESSAAAEASLTIPAYLGTIAARGNVDWASAEAEAVAPLLSSALYVGRNSLVVDRMVRRGVVHHALWIPSGSPTAIDLQVLERMAANLDATQRCVQPGGDATWTDFLCCTTARCDPRRCCTTSESDPLDLGRANGTEVVV
eukprot:TRINITY_DN11148_c0_g2_i1.p1 TRINITY_DN11148_c0_g2~~TRINITY_DN11148_c0_g2_i1.p1  ORF type:complete len:248 (-),score=49.38 TRINITY_DN11148_c0_g2_i1:73-816(-)